MGEQPEKLAVRNIDHFQTGKIETPVADGGCVGMTIIDGVVRSMRSRNTPPAKGLPVVVS